MTQRLLFDAAALPRSDAAPPLRSDARISACGRYRYWLLRRWGPGALLGWIMTNPSTAGVEVDDPTICRCIGFSQRLGFDGLLVGNLYPWRDTHPDDMFAAAARGEDIVSPDGDAAILDVARQVGLVIAAWGADERSSTRAREVLSLLRRAGVALHHLGLSASGAPKHPLARGKHRIPDDQQPIPFGPEVAHA